jgi:hypothetical protein
MSTIGIHKGRPKKIRQVLQRTKRAPEELVKHIELANLIPPASQLPDYNKLGREVLDSLTSQGMPLDWTEEPIWVHAWQVRFMEAQVKFLHRQFPPEKFPQFYEYFGRLRSSGEQIDNIISNLIGTRALLDAIAAAQAKKADSPEKEIEIPWNARMSVALALDGEGKLKVEHSPLLDALVGVEADRIRWCSECPRIFWAGRIDKHACSDKCVNRRNVRLWREHYAERYKLQRVRKADAAESTGINSRNKTRRKSK